MSPGNSAALSGGAERTPNTETNQDNGSTDLDALAYARALCEAGIPVVVCPPGGNDVVPPSGWARTTAAEALHCLGQFRPGVDALALVTGHGIDVVDVDPKNGGSIDNFVDFTPYGEHRTPSGGAHFLIPSTGIAKMTLTTDAGHVGDYLGGTVAGGSRALCFLPGSTRPKYRDAGYQVVTPIDLAGLLDGNAEPTLRSALMAAGGRVTGNPGDRAASREEVQQFLADHSTAPDRECTYGRNGVAALLDEAWEAQPGNPTFGRHAWAVKSATRTVELVRAGCAWAADLDALGARLGEIKWEEGDDWQGILAWAIPNAKGESKCGLHNPTPPENQPAIGQGTPGGSWVFDAPTALEPLWGTPAQCLWAKGEVLVLVGNTGVGKTTLGQQVMLGQLGLRGGVLGLPVASADAKVLYLALDRPRQARRSLRRMVRPDDRAVLDARLVIWDKPLPKRIEDDPDQFAALALAHGASVIIVDSLKDTSANLADNAVGAAVALAFQKTIAAGVDMMVFHHQRKGNGDNPRSIDDLYGSSQIANTAGSVVALWGKSGDVVVELRQLKQPAEEVGPFKIVHDFDKGESRIMDKFDVHAVLSTIPQGLTVSEVAGLMVDPANPDKNDIEKARRLLRRTLGLIEVGEGTRADPTRWRVLGAVKDTT